MPGRTGREQRENGLLFRAQRQFSCNLLVNPLSAHFWEPTFRALPREFHFPQHLYCGVQYYVSGCQKGGLKTYDGAFKNSEIHKHDVWLCCKCFRLTDQCSSCTGMQIEKREVVKCRFEKQSSGPIQLALQIALKLEHHGVVRGLCKCVKELDRRQVQEIQVS